MLQHSAGLRIGIVVMGVGGANCEAAKSDESQMGDKMKILKQKKKTDFLDSKRF
jgi:hypothetical protein